MKKVFGRSAEVAHVWAQQNQEEGRCRNMFFYKDKIYSYGHHFCIARILPSGVVVMTTRDYSSTTAGHKADVRGAVSHRTMVSCHNPEATAAANKDIALRDIEDALKEAETIRKVLPTTRIAGRRVALRLAEQFNLYLRALPKNERNTSIILTKPLLVSAEDRQELRDYEDKLRTRRELNYANRSERMKERQAKDALKAAENIVSWRAGTYHDRLPWNVPTMLRLSADRSEVQTSHGANIPTSHALRLWPLVKGCKDSGQGLQREVRLGHYTLNRIETNGDIVVGCHIIAFPEIEAIARELGLLKEEGMA